MYRLIALVMLLLAACGHRPAPAPLAFRDPEAPIYSSAVLEPVRLSGHWVQVAGFAVEPLSCGPGAVDIAAGQARWSLCLDPPATGAGPLVSGKPGRLAAGDMQDWWVLWVDADYRTVVIGTPSGQFGFVLNRDAAIPADRAKAVRDIFTFNGYDLAALRFF